MQVPNQSQAETTSKPVRPVSEPQPNTSPLPISEEDPAAPQEVSLAKSTSPHNCSGVFSAIQELTAEFLFDADGRVIDDPSLPSAASRNPVPREAGLMLDRTDQGKAGSSGSEAQDFAAEIESLRIALQRLQLAFSCTTTIEEHLKLASAISLITASISRLVRTQNYLASNRLPEFNREIKAALEVVVKECGRT